MLFAPILVILSKILLSQEMFAYLKRHPLASLS